MSERTGFTVIDKRGRKNKDPKPVCRVCGCQVEHSSVYNNPKMECIKYLRDRISTLEAELKTAQEEWR